MLYDLDISPVGLPPEGTPAPAVGGRERALNRLHAHRNKHSVAISNAVDPLHLQQHHLQQHRQQHLQLQAPVTRRLARLGHNVLLGERPVPSSPVLLLQATATEVRTLEDPMVGFMHTSAGDINGGSCTDTDTPGDDAEVPVAERVFQVRELLADNDNAGMRKGSNEAAAHAAKQASERLRNRRKRRAKIVEREAKAAAALQAAKQLSTEEEAEFKSKTTARVVAHARAIRQAVHFDRRERQKAQNKCIKIPFHAKSFVLRMMWGSTSAGGMPPNVQPNHHL